MPPSFLFYDLETFGQDPRRTRIAQFAAVRTDTQLNVIEEPISFLVKPADDLLPSPYATLITGITPQHAQREGINEAAAFAHIAMQMTQPHTCSLGYNTLRFRRRIHPLRAIPSLLRPIRTRVAQRQFTVGPAGHAATHARSTPRRHPLANT